MRERPIIFSAHMVLALLAGRKTMTRRIVKYVYPASFAVIGVRDAISDRDGAPSRLDIAPRDWELCPYGVPGDRLWVREAFQYCDVQLDGYEREDPVCVLFKADMKPYRCEPTARFIPNQHAEEWKIGRWRSPLYMPRWASRLTLEVTDVRVERLHDISDADARAEGVTPAPFTRAGRAADLLHVEAFEALWESIHGKGSWHANPWLWVISFRRLANA